jgi:hypothetical protein
VLREPRIAQIPAMTYQPSHAIERNAGITLLAFLLCELAYGVGQRLDGALHVPRRAFVI